MATSIPFTTIIPIMRRPLFALGFAVRPKVIVGMGTHVRYARANGPLFSPEGERVSPPLA